MTRERKAGSGSAAASGDAGAGFAQIARVVGFSAVVPLALLVAPLLTEQLIAGRGVTPSGAGLYFLFELGGISLASLPAAWLMKRWPAGRIATLAALLFIAANLASLPAMAYSVLLAVRLAAALAGGFLMILPMKIAADSPNRERLFGFWIVGQLALGAAALTVLPQAFARFGLDAFYALLAGAMLLLLPLAPGFSSDGGARASGKAADDAETRRPAGGPGSGNGVAYPAVAMLGVFGFYIGLGGCWAYVSLIASRAGLDPQAVANRLAAASLLGIVGASLASLIAGKGARGKLLPLGYGLLTAAVLALMPGQDLLLFGLSVGLFKFSWTFVLPFILSSIAAHDRSGGIMAAVNLVIGTGTSLGPLAAGWVLQRYGMIPMLAGCVGVLLLSLGAILLIETGRVAPAKR